jgi:hypothetical protein
VIIKRGTLYYNDGKTEKQQNRKFYANGQNKNTMMKESKELGKTRLLNFIVQKSFPNKKFLQHESNPLGFYLKNIFLLYFFGSYFYYVQCVLIAVIILIDSLDY